MTRQPSSSLSRLALANPVAADDARGLTPAPQTQLVRILASPRDPVPRARRIRQHRMRVVVLAIALAGCGVFAAADPFGFWRSATPAAARFAVDPTRRVPTPTATAIGCRRTGSASLACTAGAAGLRYRLVDHVSDVVPSSFGRSSLRRAVAAALANGELTAAGARRIDADIAAVPDSFFAAFRELGRFQTFETSFESSTGAALAPPAGVPTWIVCEQRRTTLGCTNLNGDEHAPLGAGIYAAVPTSDWTPLAAQPGRGPDPASQLIAAVFGHPLRGAELRLLIDLLTVSRGSSQQGSVRGVTGRSGRS